MTTTAAHARHTESATIGAIGAMSGTSGDGVDLAYVETDGVKTVRRRARFFLPFAVEETAAILAAAERIAAAGQVDRDDPAVRRAEEIVTLRHEEALAAFAAEARIDMSAVSVIGMHGQTLFHDPRRGVSLQVGDPRRLAARFGVPVASNFRLADILDGGEGAPLAPIYHRMLIGEDDLPSVVVNIGGVTNITWLGSDGSVLGFDTGAGNGALDRFVRDRTDRSFDEDGALSAEGTPDLSVLASLMDDAYYAAPPPKSLDRSTVLASLPDRIGAEDGAATLVAFVAAGLEAALRHLPDGGRQVRRWIVAGGGRRNPSILAAMRARLPGDVVPIEAIGHDGDMIEAELFAVLGARRMLGISSSMLRPGGGTAEVLLGDLVRP
ncbi:MAG TPA: anhydro-N-acetylmuramic acid kinase [Methylomirabilota bacterium]|nr:anhydro-N-acetylmuramic acid kinase [Methylomirabilota bacterium]